MEQEKQLENEKFEIKDLREKPLEIQIAEFLISKGVSTLEQVKSLLEPNFFAIIPINILEKRNLSANAKLLYAEIVALSKKSGKCFATNEYLAERLGLSKRSIPTLLKELKKERLIKISINRNNKGTFRNIVLKLYNDRGGASQNNDGGYRRTTMGGIANERGQNRNRQREIDNNNNIILHSNSTELPQNPSLKEEKKPKSKKDTNPEVLEVFKYFKEICAEELDFEPVINYGKEGALIKRTLPLLEKNNVTWQELIDAYIYSKKADELGASLGIIFSSNNVNQFLTKKGRLSK